MGASQKQLIDVFKRQCQAREDRYSGYRKDLLVALADIANIERSHNIAPTNVVQKIYDQCEALGDLTMRKTTSTDQGSQ